MYVCASIQIKNGALWIVSLRLPLHSHPSFCLPHLTVLHLNLLARLFSTLTPKRCLCAGLKGLNVSPFSAARPWKAVFNPVYSLASIWPGVLYLTHLTHLTHLTPFKQLDGNSDVFQ